MIRDQQMFCDGCGNRITKITTVPEGGWGPMHNLCSSCFDALRATAIPRG